MSLQKKASPLKYTRADTDAEIDFLNDLTLNVKEASYGALGNDTGNDAPAIQAAIDDMPSSGGVVYMPRGTYRCTTGIVFPTDRQVRLIGAGRGATIIHVVAGTTATPGIIHIRGTEKRSSVEYIEITFDQPDTVIRANLTAFVPAIYAQGIARFRVQHVRIVRAWVGIDLRTNSNCEINDLEISHFDTGIWIDGSLDSIRISHLHDWPFECTPNQITALSDEANAGIRAGRTDGTHISDSLFHTGTGIIATASVVTTGKPVLYITNCSFDTYSGIKMTAGIVMVTNCGFGTFTASGYQAIHATASTEISALTVSNCVFTSNGGTGAVMELIGSASANALFVTLMGAGFNTAAGNQSSLRADSVAGGIIHLHVSQCHFSREGNVAYTAATISIGTNVRSIISNNMGTDKGTGAGTMVEVTTDGRHIITDNMFLGWSLTLPSTHTTISARGNTDAGGSSQYARGGEMQMGAHVYRTTSQTIPGSTVTVLTFDAERNDASGWHSTVTNTSRLTAPVAGWYLIGGTVEWATGNTVGARYALLILNGATQIAMAGGPVGTSAEAIQLTPAVAWYMNAGDYVELNLYQTSGGSLQILATPARSPEFWILRTGS